MTADEWVATHLEQAPPLTAEQAERISQLLAGAAHNVEAAAQVSITEGDHKP